MMSHKFYSYTVVFLSSCLSSVEHTKYILPVYHSLRSVATVKTFSARQYVRINTAKFLFFIDFVCIFFKVII